jgi:hypothetical protein
MDQQQFSMVVPRLRDQDKAMKLQAWVSEDNFNPGYIKRSLHKLPRQGSHLPWLHTQDFARDKDLLPQQDLNDGTLYFQ